MESRRTIKAHPYSSIRVCLDRNESTCSAACSHRRVPAAHLHTLAARLWRALVRLLQTSRHCGTGGILEVFTYKFNMRQLSNGTAIWLGIEPPDLFIFVILPPLLVDSALRIDFFMFRKVMVQVRTRSPP